MKGLWMRRLVNALLITLGIWIAATFVFAVVAHIDGDSWLIYPLGVLTVVPIPIALVFIFLMMKQAFEE